MTRLFTAIDFPEEIVERLSFLKLNIPKAKWTPRDQMHLTLRFIGEVNGSIFAQIRDALDEIDYSSFYIRPMGVDSFHSKRSPRILWANLEKNDDLVNLQNLIDKKLTNLGVASDSRKFSPHITLARLQNKSFHHVVDFLQTFSSFQTEPFIIDQFHLYESKLTSKRAIHTLIETYPLN